MDRFQGALQCPNPVLFRPRLCQAAEMTAERALPREYARRLASPMTHAQRLNANGRQECLIISYR